MSSPKICAAHEVPPLGWIAGARMAHGRHTAGGALHRI